jgi:hypothetical protein
MQKNLHSFFKISRIHNENHKRCFIYDSATYKAFFAPSPNEETDTFVSIKSGVKLYYRKQQQQHIVLPIIQTSADIPLLKSNLQKAIRRGNHSIAISTALAMMQKDATQFLRRLPVIYIEDVCLIDSFPITMWLLMADARYTLTQTDICILLQIVYSLCSCSKYFEFRDNECKTEYTHESLENEERFSEVLSLHYRYLYGGLKGDMQMLNTAIGFYCINPHEIVRYTFSDTLLPFNIGVVVVIMKEAIDFHPFPTMITSLFKLTKIDKQLIKDCIWVAESGYNRRKPHTVEMSEKYKKGKEYQIIELHLDKIRSECVK